MSEHDEAGDGAARRLDTRARLAAISASGSLRPGHGRGGGLCTFLGRCRSPCWWSLVTMLLSWEWGRLVHGREGGCRYRRACAAAALAAVLAALGYVGLGLLALPIGAILATLLSLGRNSVFSALGVFYAGLPAVALIWLRSDPRSGCWPSSSSLSSSSPPIPRASSPAG